MIIRNYLSQHRNDFAAVLVCESCGTTGVLSTGYHDAFFHNHVIPTINCPTCDRNHYGESSELGAARRKREGVNGTVGLANIQEAPIVKAADKKDGGGE